MKMDSHKAYMWNRKERLWH